MPYIISLRGSDVPGEHARLKLDYKVLGPVFRAIWKNAAVLVACSQGLKERALRFMPSASIEVIPNGVDMARFCPAENNSKSDVLRLLTVGRLSVTKRVETLIDAVEVLNKSDIQLHFTIIGGGRMARELRTLVSNKGLSDIIEITGRVDAEDMPQIYRQSDIFISASMQEGMSNAMLEAMASGLPIISTRCEGVEELIADNGIIVEKPQAKHIANAVESLAEDRHAYEQMAAAARKRAEQFSWNRVAEQYLAIYDEII
jgi:glycosyltransferase involved in cell wall biosynthesis